MCHCTLADSCAIKHNTINNCCFLWVLAHFQACMSATALLDGASVNSVAQKALHSYSLKIHLSECLENVTSIPLKAQFIQNTWKVQTQQITFWDERHVYLLLNVCRGISLLLCCDRFEPDLDYERFGVVSGARVTSRFVSTVILDKIVRLLWSGLEIGNNWRILAVVKAILLILSNIVKQLVRHL